MEISPCSSLQQEFANELNRAVELEVGVFLFRESVAFIFRHEKPDRRSLFLEGGDDLFGFRFRHSWIVRALDHEEWFRDFLRVCRVVVNAYTSTTLADPAGLAEDLAPLVEWSESVAAVNSAVQPARLSADVRRALTGNLAAKLART